MLRVQRVQGSIASRSKGSRFNRCAFKGFKVQLLRVQRVQGSIASRSKGSRFKAARSIVQLFKCSNVLLFIYSTVNFLTFNASRSKGSRFNCFAFKVQGFAFKGLNPHVITLSHYHITKLSHYRITKLTHYPIIALI